MKILSKTLIAGFSFLLAAVSFNPAQAQSARSVLEIYDEGPVWHMIYIRTGTGQREAYLDALSGTWKRQVELAEEIGFVIGHDVITKWPTGPDDWDVLIIEKFPNMAAYDTFWLDWAGVDQAVINDPETERQQGTLLNPERTILGYHIAREVIFKEE